MIRFSLSCANDHAFDGWFRNGEDFEAQKKRGLVSCPVCRSAEVEKALMAPAVSTGRKRDRIALALGEEQRKALAKLKAIKTSKMSKEEKRAALLELMPIIELAESKVWHPSEKYSKTWHSWSPERHMAAYAKYIEYAENAMNKGSGKKHHGAKSNGFGSSGFGKSNFLSKSHKPLY